MYLRTRMPVKRLLTLLFCMLMPLTALAGGDDPPVAAQTLRGWDNQAGYEYLEFGLFHQEAGVEPIYWRVLAVQDGKALLLSEKILECRFFGWGNNEWEGSELQWWLNENFIAQAFSAEEEAMLISDAMVGTVRVPLQSDLLNPDYGFQKTGGKKDVQRRAQGTSFAIGHGLWVADDGYGAYFTRTKGSSKESPTLVTVRSTGAMGAASVDRENVGVRPMLWLDLSAAADYVLEGEGTLEAPFRLVRSMR